MPILNQRPPVRFSRLASARARARLTAVLGPVALLVTLGLPATTAAAAQPVRVTVTSSSSFTPTGITVTAGESITVSASGTIHFGPPPIDRITPNGLPPSACADLIRREGATRPFPAPGLRCWALLGRIGTGKPFLVGAQTTLRATSSGALLLGVNDNRLADNDGTFAATITVAAAPGSNGSGGSSGSNAVVFVVIGLVVVLALAALFLVRRRRPTDGEGAIAAAGEPVDVAPADAASADAAPAAVPVDEPADEPASVDETVPAFTRPPGPLGTSVAPGEDEIPDTNIFEVEIANGTDLRVGYNYFPADTDLHWQVRQGGVFARGQFPTEGGGNIYHYVTLPLGVRLAPAPAAVDVQFNWSIGGVPFRYAVRRDPGI